jgi:hypothetical protein
MTFSPSLIATVRRRGLPILSREPVSHRGDSRMGVWPHEGALTHAHLYDLPNNIRGKDMMDNELPKKTVRFDFPPGASVQVGVIGLTIRLAATCRKFKLIANGPKPGNWFCNSCQ